MKIRELMTTPAIACRIDDTLNEAARLMWERDCGVIMVTGGDDELVGVVTDRDVCIAAYTQGTNLQSIPVSAAMAKQVISAHEDDSLEAVERLMSEGQVRRVPIVDDDNRPLGLFSLNDLARYAASKTDGVSRGAVRTLSAICEPRMAPAQAETAEVQ